MLTPALSMRPSGISSRFRLDASALLGIPGAVAVLASLFFPWLTLSLSACLFSVCGSSKSGAFTVIQISTANEFLSLMGGPLAALVPLVASYAQLALWCLGTAGVGLLSAGYRFQRPSEGGRSDKIDRIERLVISWLLSAAQLFLVVKTILQMYSTFQLQNAASISILNVSPGSYTQAGPLLLLLGLALLSAAALLGLRIPKARANALVGATSSAKIP
jgi:hypothetical protein